MKTVEQLPQLDAAAVAGLSRTFFDSPGFDAVQYVRDGVASGRMQLWRVGESYAVTELCGDSLVVVCYQGGDGVAFMRRICAAAKRRGLRAVRYWTLRRGMSRLLKDFAPRAIGENVYEIGV